MNNQTFLQPNNKPETTTLLARKQIEEKAAAHLGQAKNPAPHQEWRTPPTDQPTYYFSNWRRRGRGEEEGAEEEREAKVEEHTQRHLRVFK